MMGKVTFRNIFIISMVLLLIIAADKHNALKVPAVQDELIEPVLWLYKGNRLNNSTGDLYVKRFNQEAHLIAEEVLRGSHMADIHTDKVLYLNGHGQLFLFQEGIGSKLLAADVPMFQYEFSNNGSSVYYKTFNDELYVLTLGTHLHKIANHVKTYRPAAKGAAVYYINSKNQLYFQEEDNYWLVASNVLSFLPSVDNHKVIYMDSARVLYWADMHKANSVSRVVSNAKTQSMEFSSDETKVIYSAIADDKSKSVALFIYKKRSNGVLNKKVVEGVSDYLVLHDGNRIVYSNANLKLYQYDIKANIRKLIASQVAYFKMNREEDQLIYLTIEGQLFLKQGLSGAVKIAEHASQPEFTHDDTLFFTQNDQQVYYKLPDRENNNLASSRVYSMDSHQLYYITQDGSIGVWQQDKGEDRPWLQDISNYIEIYSNHNLLYKRPVDSDYADGYWQSQDGEGYVSFVSERGNAGVLTINEPNNKQVIPVIKQFFTEHELHVLLLGEKQTKAVLTVVGNALELNIGGSIRHLTRSTSNAVDAGNEQEKPDFEFKQRDD